MLCDSAGVDLMLVELYPKARSSREAIVNARNASLSLVNFSDNQFLVHYLGHGLFALVSAHARSMSRVGTMLLSWLRREGFVRVHIGYSSKEQTESSNSTGKLLFDEAWQALLAAGKRGPYSFCDFSLLAHPEQHPLRRPPRRVVAKFSRKWKDVDRFSIVQIQSDTELAKTLTAALGMNETVVCDHNDIYIFLEGKDFRQAQGWVNRKLLELKRKIPQGRQFFIGIGTYPFADFSKSEVLHNCRKAVLHASFYGSGGVAVFDAVSLNISGDVYYQEGDLANAIREYKKGLICEKNNINLLNSLGVAYAMMEKHRMAHQCFNKVISIDPDNFMALYNLGFGEKYLGMNESAILRFEKALAVSQGDDEKVEVQKDIEFQLGKLYCLTEEFSKAVDILLPWYEKEKGSKKVGYACSFLGKSFHGLNDNTEAVVWLQRALQFDGFDAESMGILGEVYLEQAEGDEIALSLCKKSVEIDPADLHLKLRLAKVLTACGKYSEAKDILRPCLRNKGTRAKAELQNGVICHLEGRSKKALGWFSKVLDRNDASEPVIQQAQRYLEIEGHGQ
jgi:tetratricopeptide (TPR) repeat protein